MKLAIGIVLSLCAAGAGAAEPRVIEISAGSYYFKPDKIQLRVGEPVTLKVRNEGSVVPHDLIVNAPEAGIDIHIAVSGGATASASFTPTKAGTYDMYCGKKMVLMKSHRDKGMAGTLEVVE